MNLEAINKWLDEEYGCSYTRLEELHDFYFEKYTDLKEENKQLKANWNKLKEFVLKKQAILFETEYICYSNILHKMQELEQGKE